VRAVCVSPQCRKAWLQEVAQWLEQLADGLHHIPLMLILDVQTRWYSTHQMLHKYYFVFPPISNTNISFLIGRAIQYRKVIEHFVAVNKYLRAFELTDDDWSAITLISQWLKSFCSATVQMSATRKPMLSSTLTIFRGLQDSLHKTLHTLPNNTPLIPKEGLVNAHLKLSNYYRKTDNSPYYVWACHRFSFFYCFGSCSLDSVLDPRIGYAGLVADCEGEATSLQELEQVKDNLEQYFCSHYCTPPSRPSTPPLSSSPTAPLSAFDSPEKVNFTAHYETLPMESVDEWEEFLTLKCESFTTCDPIRCWGGRSSRFPKLSTLAHGILSIPGMSLLDYAIHF